MSYDATIKIFGKVSNPEAVWELALAASAETRVGWIDSFEPSAFLSMLQSASADGEALTLTRSSTDDLLNGVSEACREAGLSYVVSYGENGGDGFTDGFSWRPGMPDEVSFSLDGETPTLPLAQVAEAAKAGIEAVRALVAQTAANTWVGSVVIEPGFEESYREHVGEDRAPRM